MTVMSRPAPRVMDPERCSEIIWSFRLTHTIQDQCRRRGTIDEGGQLWCYQHAPSRVAKRREHHAEKHQERYERVHKPRAHAVAMLRIIREIANGVVQNPQSLCAAFLGEYERQ